jgi:hypothetical protein
MRTWHGLRRRGGKECPEDVEGVDELHQRSDGVGPLLYPVVHIAVSKLEGGVAHFEAARVGRRAPLLCASQPGSA